jgi:small-conductance mechanosensitive channel
MGSGSVLSEHAVGGDPIRGRRLPVPCRPGRPRHVDTRDHTPPVRPSVSWTEFLPTLVPVVVASALLAGSYALSSRVARWSRSRGAPPAAVRGTRLAISLTGGLLAVAVLFVAFGPLTVSVGLTLSAVIGLAATLALQTTIGNVIAGFILLRDRMLRQNDEIQISGVRGIVVRFGLVTTLIRLQDGSLAVVSNSNLLSGPLVNSSAASRLKGEV